ncbi:HAMP domain-containing sensor histidine kinase [Pseudoalteromonas sp. NBT06-2]|uniref:sensor histidine kinase n=1 Tax=Pseudoalteromonas sp. NBT06-2 TaxID=2025950 RepID=UPI0020758A58|nr:HAMP domain-containing sensor histidine kinase [Pseudoalteromonas sp. NBT06-2]
MQLTTYTQVLKEGEHNLKYKKQNKNNLLLELQQEIEVLAQTKLKNNTQNDTVESVLSHILDSWPIPVCVFDHNLSLIYRNSAMNEQIQQPMLNGTSASSLGFEFNHGQFSHNQFDDKWQNQSISYLNQSQKHWLYSAIDISQILNENQTTTQKNLVRVLSHELRNSLTPMASMADTLLCSEQLNESQTRMVLDRIKSRSERLLAFIGQYSQLAQLPEPQCTWFNFMDILDEAKSMMSTELQVSYKGAALCYGDENQVSQILINLLKNAQESCEKDTSEVSITLYNQQQNQIIEMTDNGPGFANLDNVLTPFYTTKPAGSGIGLSLCDNIVRNHQGQLKVSNLDPHGAKITLVWPIKQVH